MRTLYLTILVICLTGCVKKTQPIDESIQLEGDIISELTNSKYNPFTFATVKLYDKSTIQSLTPLATATVDPSGHYILTAKHSLNEDGFAVLNGDANSNYAVGYTNNIIFANSIKSDFIIKCSSTLERIFINQSNNPYDSIVMYVSNSKESTKIKYALSGYRTVLLCNLQGQEPNYLNSKFYYSNTFIQRFDTINTTCLTLVRDSIFY